jgi:diguanylate cyclase (GGDEF)-like protein
MATILVVDDRAANRDFLATLLGYVGHDVLQAGNGAEALDVVRSRHPQLVITDVLMPKMGGIEFADRVHDDPTTAHTPIIFYTATYRAPQARVLADSCNVAAVIVKPAEPQAILDAVAAALGNGPAPALIPQTVTSYPSFLGAKLPPSLRDLAELQTRLRRALDDAVEHPGADTAVAEDDSVTQRSLHALSLRLARLLQLDLALSSERNPEEILRVFCRSAQDIISSRYVAVGMLNAEGHQLQHFAARGLDAETQAMLGASDPKNGVLGAIIASGKPQRIHAKPDAPPALGLPEFHPPVSSLLAVPVPVRTAMPLTGWIYFAGKLGADAFDGDDEQFAITLAAQLALAYGNLMLYEEIQQRAAMLEIEVAERRRAQSELAHRMTHDQTTGLPRLAPIEEYLQAEIVSALARDRRIFLLYADIDRFHVINETRGRAMGDHVLRTVAGRLSAMVGDLGRVAHVAGDEFVAILADPSDTQDQLELGEAMRVLIEEPIEHGDEFIYITCSIGVSCYPDNGAASSELLREAEAAMLRAKREGRNTVSAFSNEQKQELEEKRTLGARLREAIGGDQLFLQYQPLISGHDWQILGFEALVRWRHPELGLLEPKRFIPVAEDLGLIVELGSFVLDSACRQVRAWLDEGVSDFVVSINIAALQLQRPNFVEVVRSALTRFGVPARSLELELTESAMTHGTEGVINTMHALKALGVRIVLDDFGTGYSSLNYLRQFPTDQLKIDQSFVRDITTDASSAGICRAIISLGHQLGMTVLAEGVETAAQVGYLLRNECDAFQGFYFSRPVNATQARDLLRHRYMSRDAFLQPKKEQALLLVDDEENILRALTRALRRDGYRILTATGAHEAFELLAKNEIQVIISDQRMPDVSGTEFLSQVKEMYPATVRIVLSGYTDLTAVTDAINRGAIYKFLTKPWNDDDLRTQIREAFRVSKAHANAYSNVGT